MLLIHPIREVGRAIPALVGILFASSSSGHDWWTAAAVAVVILLSLLRWFTTRYQITPEQVQLRTGLFRRRSMTTPADRVRTVDVTAHALHRVLGLARVSIGTGISDRKREGLVLDGLTADAASRLRAELLHRARLSGAGLPSGAVTPSGAVPAPGAVSPSGPALPLPPAVSWPADESLPAAVSWPAGPRQQPGPPAAAGWEPAEEPIAVLDPSWIRYAPFTLSGAATALAVLGFGWRLFDQTRVSGKATVIHSVTRQFDHRPIWLDVLQGVLGAVLTVVVLSMIGYLLAFWNFRLTRHAGGSLHVSRGLITTRATSIEERRLHGVELSALLPLRWVGGARLLAIATGLRVGRGAERGGTLLMPACPSEQARRVAAAVLTDTTNTIEFPLRSHGKRALRRRLNRAVLPTVPVVLLLLVLWLTGLLPGWPVLVALPLPILAVPLALDRYRNLGHGYTRRYLHIGRGSLLRRRVVLRTEGIIGWNLRQSFFQRRAGLVTLTATTAAGRQAYPITDLDGAAALALADQAVPGLLAEFLIS